MQYSSSNVCTYVVASVQGGRTVGRVERWWWWYVRVYVCMYVCVGVGGWMDGDRDEGRGEECNTQATAELSKVIFESSLPSFPSRELPR